MFTVSTLLTGSENVQTGELERDPCYEILHVWVTHKELEVCIFDTNVCIFRIFPIF